MAAHYPDELFEALEAGVTAIVPYDFVSELDSFTPAHTAGPNALDTIERDRVFVALPTSGPLRILGHSCPTSGFSIALSFRYFDNRESRKRMLRDTTYIEEALRALQRALRIEIKIVGPTYDYGVLNGQNSVVVRWDLTIEFKPVVEA